MTSDFMSTLSGGHMASIWIEGDSLHVIYRDTHYKEKKKIYNVGQISPPEVAFMFDMDMLDGQIWLQKLVKFNGYVPCYDDLWFDNIDKFKDAATHPGSRDGKKLKKFFRGLTGKVKKQLRDY